MGFYAKHVLPHVVHLACGTKPNRRQRQKIVPLAKGRVLEIGIGSGLNLEFYDSARVEHVWGLDPSPEMWAIAEASARKQPFKVEFIEAGAERIPLEDRSVDTVVITYTLCTIPEATAALADMRRVLKPGGELVFCEHGLAPDEGVRRWQHRVNPVWRRVGGGCNLNRDIPSLLKAGGFRIRDMDTMYIPGWKPASFNYWGTAV
jgi:ubiquinone/menaquinone biosynthesis C-methylase UbiE